ncbi:hypothetical protein PMW_03 [Pseudomonas phage phiPMW]|uniref:Uncharacterized protein n=1 Tax=Pseudomonas phage phiPMW TaxID=1815582 RepID=A0A1S5R175_9CAUD|nr:thymidylate synthase [Pseudomonas phage phiPMW]ANA49128.1 hypothetical protein PMW_03 [Pseudomonas phage phiPMW]
MVEKVNEYGEFDQYLTQLDLMLHPKWKEFVKGDDSVFETILHDFGADLKFGFTSEVETVRARRKDLYPYQQVQTGLVVRFRERRDKAWEPYRCITDIVRTNIGTTTDALARVGMMESLGTTNPLNEAIEKDEGFEVAVQIIELEKE